jgi:hypothetical protein
MKWFLIAVAATSLISLSGCSHPGFKADNAKSGPTHLA